MKRHGLTRRITVTAVAAAALALAACATQRDIQPQARLTAPDSLGRLPDANAGDWKVSERYWEAFGDAQLDALVQEALASAPSLALADTRIRRAAALTDAAGSALWPQVSLDYATTAQRYTEHGMVSPTYAGTTRTSNSLLLNAGIELDVWGKYRRALQGAQAQHEAAGLEARAARVALAAAVTRAYLEFDRQQRQLALLDRVMTLRAEAERLQGLRVQAGLDTEIDRNLQQLGIAQLRGERAQLEERIALQRNALAALAGQGPERGARLAAPALRAELDARLPSQLPSDLLANRPDLQAARLRVEAAGADVDYARAQFYPSVNLSAFLGFSSIGLDMLLDHGSRVYGAGPAIHLPIFEAGRLRAGLAGKTADYDAAVAQYNASLVDALREVCDQARGLEGAARQGERVQEAREAAVRGAALVQTRLGQGLASRIQLISAQLQVLAQERSALDVRAHRLDAAVGLARALGGGIPAGAPVFTDTPPQS
ncbi:MAG: efflux transporter outer membrane subunit [Candidatus Dactylopiibacterium sp.]|nr:efflux transporter outer membrane subunit [Candidatus Dactylopiibacterium sp.]